MNLGRVYHLHFTILFCIIFLTFDTFAVKCVSSSDPITQQSADAGCAKALGKGVVCSSSGPTINICIYACHSNADCKSGICDKGQTPHWLCTCDPQNGGTDCYETGMGFCNAGDANHCMSDSLNSTDFSVPP
ncbi:hypothetical protein RclHR1_00370033 [Rhizophagus clarus]|uniref:EGF-like domain-containing protein n=1 Tax=Rhizophagus clarus TaxID=94130 RepID=A0A2Z6RG35_9GLOM|nr:hypothetical protein RclHR1_00370033 [Rhizophagus clarus]GET03598.1 hypothetical protein GLOIN_2v1520874 [Rhizophagus clarus]